MDGDWGWWGGWGWIMVAGLIGWLIASARRGLSVTPRLSEVPG